MNADKSIMGRIEELVTEEHRLRTAVQEGTIASEEESARLHEVEVALDQCWDLLRRRRAARDSGSNPDAVTARSAGEVEGYLH